MKETDKKSPDTGVIRWISPEWLETHLKDAGLIIIDCRQNSHAYFTNHIPGAMYLNEALLRMHVGGIPVRWIPAALAEVLFRTLGLEQDSPIVLYSESRQKNSSAPCSGDGLEAACVGYSLARFGCRCVMILNGGLDTWKAKGRVLAQDFKVSSPSEFTVEIPTGMFIDYQEFLRIKDRKEVVLLDTRPAAVYEGPGPWRKPGHIPGAVNLPAGHLMDTENTTLLKPAGEIYTILARNGITREKTIICSCGTGRTATSIFLILKWYLGYPHVVMFEGGFTEWVSHAGNMTVTGKMPR